MTVVAGVVVACCVATIWGVAVAQAGQSLTTAAADGRVRIFYTAPILVRAGERVLVAVDAVCATARGGPCPAVVTMHAGAGRRSYHTASAAASPGLRFDLSAAAADAVSGRATSGFVRFSIEANAGAARASVPPDNGAPLLFYVARSVPAVKVPDVPFARERRGRAVLSLPWGNGPNRAGIALGGGDPPVGPSAFDVDGAGRVFLLDTEQSRLGVFSAGRLVRSTPLALAPRSDIALSPGGTAFVLARGADGRVDLTRVSPGTAAQTVSADAAGIPGAIRAVGGAAYVHVFPLDAWLPVAGTSATRAPEAPSVGRPLPGGRELLSVVRGRRLRLGTVVGGRVRHAVELVFRRALGELALAAPDRAGGYWAVVHVWRDRPRPADAFQAVHVRGRRVVSTFLLPSDGYTPDAPQSALRIGPNGGLYQLLTSADGVRVVRYRIGGER